MKQTSKTSFKPDWLDLREPADIEARNADILALAAACVTDGGVVLDLGAGTGSTARAFRAAGHKDLNWRFVDNDPALLEAAQARFPTSECVLGDLANVDELPMKGASMVTASAVLDLMSETWVKDLLARAGAFGLPIYAALNFNGAMYWSPSDLRDREVTEAFNTHQRRDKGTGLAMGASAAATLAKIAKASGWNVHMAESPWQLGKQHAALQEALLTGIADAAHEAGAPCALAWGADRRAGAESSLAMIGHHDVLVRPRESGKKCLPLVNRSSVYALS